MENNLNLIEQRTREILGSLPPGIQVVGAAKTRTASEVASALRGGLRIIGHNYLQEAERMFPAIGEKARWHFIGSIQKNKIRRMIRIFDMIETLDSIRHCETIEKYCAFNGRTMPVLIEINIARESSKSGIMPEEITAFIEEAAGFPHLSIEGLMTMGPASGAKAAAGYFRIMKNIFDGVAGMNLPGVRMKYLSMGMSDTYLAAVREGANLVRIGTKIFGARNAA